MKPRLMVLVIVVLGGLLGVAAWRFSDPGVARPAPPSGDAETLVADPPGSPDQTRSAPAPASPPQTAVRVGYVTTREGTGLRPAGAETATRVAGGILLPVLAETADGFVVLDTCNGEASVEAEEVESGSVSAVRGGGFDEAVFVIDPGHGGPDYGAVGPAGLAEREVNLDVASRVVELLRSPQQVDRQTGAVTPGEEIPAAAVAVLTRGPTGPAGGEYQLGLRFRSTVGNSLEATALVSIHHNSGPEIALDHPGSEAFVSISNPESPRLGALMVDELRTAFSGFSADWMGSAGSGVISRVDAAGEDYYSILAGSEVPAVIVEGAYISNPSEEVLAQTDEFRQAYAEGVYRALVRFVTTDDHPIPPPEPVLWEVDRPGPSMSDCRVPSP